MLSKTLKLTQQISKLPTRNFASGTSFEKFDFMDPLNLNMKLTDDERMIEESAKAFAQEKLMPRVMKAYREEHFDLDIMKEFGELGFLGCSIPEYGLPGVSSTAYGLINRQIEYVDSGYRSALSVQSSLVMYPIYTFGN
jgi:glutaryl-CoA dehydrogenase